MTTEQNPAKLESMSRQRRLWLIAVIGALALVAIISSAYWAFVLRFEEFTDDAYVSGNVVQITPQISGIVVQIGADNTQFVRAGQTVVQLDRADAKVALDQAEAQLARTVREVRNLFSTSAQLAATLQVREADLTTATADLARRERLASSGAISGEELQHARDAFKAAQAAVLSARQQLAANRARVDGTTVENHPDVQNAAAAVRAAFLAYARTSLPAPVSGFVAQRSVQLGQRVNPGTPLMAIVPLDQVWVDANFKEPQLASMRVGQRVDLIADLYGHGLTYHGRIVGFNAGTGSAFAILPAQNATGNWIKIVQRVPVRIALDSGELAAHPLQIGLSMKAQVDTHTRDGARLPQVAQNAPLYSTDVFGAPDQVADQRVRQIIAQNIPPAAVSLAGAKQAPSDATAMNRLATIRAIPAIHTVPAMPAGRTM
jgi:membrane fusion protein (multidrug efflux system)